MAIPLLIPLIMAGVSAVSGIASSVASGNAAAKAEKQLQERRDKAERQYLHEYNTDFLDTETAKSTLSQLRKQKEKQMEAANNDAVKQGTSEEGKVAMAGKLNEGYADAVSRLAGFGTQYKEQAKDRYQRRVDSLDDALYNSQLNKASALGDLVGSVGGVANAGLQAYGAGAFGSTLGQSDNTALGRSSVDQVNKNNFSKAAPNLSNVALPKVTSPYQISNSQYR